MPRDLIQHPDPLPIAHPDTADPDAAVLLRAADYIERNGFARSIAGQLPATCARGGIAYALGYSLPSFMDLMSPGPHPYYSDKRAQRIEDSLGVGDDVPAWNDKSDMATVIRTMRFGDRETASL